jgi:hypothetical protein
LTKNIIFNLKKQYSRSIQATASSIQMHCFGYFCSKIKAKRDSYHSVLVGSAAKAGVPAANAIVASVKEILNKDIIFSQK